MHDNNQFTENDHSNDHNLVIIIDDDDDDDDDDYTNPLITMMGSCGAHGLAPDVTATLLAVVVPTPTPPTIHASAKSMNIGGAPLAASIVALTIPPPPASMVATNITRAPLSTTMCVATQTTLDHSVKGNNGSGEASARNRYHGNSKVVARYNNCCGKSITGYGNVDYGKGVAGYSDVSYGGKSLVRCSSGSHTYNTSTATRGDGNKACGKVYSCPKCKNTFFTTPSGRQATLLIITRSWRRRATHS